MYKNLREACKTIIECVDPTGPRSGTEETPDRMAKALCEHTMGYAVDPAVVLKCFEDGATGYDEMIVVSNIRFYSRCEHHMEAIVGMACIGYIPDKRIIGLSKLARLTEVFARRLQVQERMTVQIAETFDEVIQPRGVAVQIRARHLCMESRGVRLPGAITTTTHLRGVMKHGEPRAEFLQRAYTEEPL